MVVGSLINFLVGRFEQVFSRVVDNARQYASLGVPPSNRGVPFLFRFPGRRADARGDRCHRTPQRYD
jgi:hypothetical protein